MHKADKAVFISIKLFVLGLQKNKKTPFLRGLSLQSYTIIFSFQHYLRKNQKRY